MQRLLLPALLAALATGAAHGQTWTGATDTNWNTAGNWSAGAVPTAGASVLVPGGPTNQPVKAGASAGALGSLTLGAGARLVVAQGGALATATLDVQPGSASVPTRLALAAGTASAPGGTLSVTVGDGAFGANTALTVGDHAALNLSADFANNGATVAFADQGELGFGTAGGALHSLGGTATTQVGVLSVNDLNDILNVDAPVVVTNRVGNLGTVNIVAPATLTLRATSTQTAVLGVVAFPGGVTLGSYSGSIVSQVYLDGSRFAGAGYRHLCPPVTGATVASFANGSFVPTLNAAYNSSATPGATVPFPTVFTYDQARLPAGGPAADFAKGWTSPTALTNLLALGKGYTVNTPAGQVLNFRGNTRTSGFTLSGLARGTGAQAGWQFLGNPYAAPLDWAALLVGRSGLAGITDLDAALYVSKCDGQYSGTYASFIGGIGANGGTNVIPVGQAFFVRTSAAAAPAGGSIRFNPAYLLAAPNATAVQRTGPDRRPRLTLALQDGARARARAHETVLYFEAGNTAGFDPAADAIFVPGPAQALAVASAAAAELLSINGLPALAGQDVTVPLHLSATTGGTYTLAATALQNLPAGYFAYLRDNAAGTYTNLATTPGTRVALAANAAPAGRYAVVFSTQVRGTLAAAPAALAALASVSPNPAAGRATLVLPAALRGGQPVPVALLNGLGQAVRAYTFGTAAETLELSLDGLAAGIYTVQARTTAGLVAKRLVVAQ